MIKRNATLKTNWLVIPVAMWILTGCQSNPSMVEENFGSSVRNVIALQTAQPGQNTPALDGQKGEAVLGTYRTDVAKPENVERDLIQIRLGK